MTLLDFVHEHFFGIGFLLFLLGSAVFTHLDLRARLRK
jgi:hypothetical protein